MAAVKTLRVSSGGPWAQLATARRFLETARAALAELDYGAAVLTAVQAGMRAADAVTVAVKGQRSIDPDRERVVDLLVDVRQCHAWRATARDASHGVEQAERIVECATAVVLRFEGPGSRRGVPRGVLRTS